MGNLTVGVFPLSTGVVPFARELLLTGATVILCANLRPALNDVTIDELKVICGQIADIDPVWKSAAEGGRIELLDSAHGSPCLDLSRMNK